MISSVIARPLLGMSRTSLS